MQNSQWTLNDECFYKDRKEQFWFREMVLLESLLDKCKNINNIVKKYKDTLKLYVSLRFPYTYTHDSFGLNNNTEIQKLKQEIADLRMKIISSNDYYYISPVRERCKIYLIKYESIFHNYSYFDIQRSKQTEEYLDSLNKQINDIHKLNN